MIAQARHALRDERGFTIVEGVVAILVLAIGSMASMQVFDVATRTTYRAEQSQSLVNRMQAELEEVKGLPFGRIAMSAMPTYTADENDPRSRVQGTDYAIERGGTDPAPILVDSANGAVSPDPEPFDVGDVSGQIYKFVVWRDDPSCPESLCPGVEDLKRVIVSARVDATGASFDRAYQEVQGDVGDPDATPVANPGPGGAEKAGAVAEFSLTDTPCDSATRQKIVADHATHNTRGACSAGLKTGSLDPGAPDLMFTEAPALDPGYPPDGQPIYDYSNDQPPALNPELHEGLFVRRPSIDGCLLDTVGGLVDLPLTEIDRHQKVHKWVSAPMPQAFELLLLGEGSLELRTRTVNGASQAGHICVTLFIRKLDGDGLPVDVPVLNLNSLAYFEYSQASWPAEWTEISVPLEFVAPGTILPGEKIGVAVQVIRNGTGNDGLDFMYDHPSLDSRLQLQTDRALGP